MQALVQNGYGSVEMLEIREVVTPAPADNQILVKVCATAINDWEWGEYLNLLSYCACCLDYEDREVNFALWAVISQG